MMKKLLSEMKHDTIEEYYDHFDLVEEMLEAWERQFMPQKDHQKDIMELCESLALKMPDFPVWMRIHILSFCMKCSGDVKYAEWLMREVLDADYDILGEYNKYFLYWQISSSIFDNTKLQSHVVNNGRVKLYRELYEAFSKALQVDRYPYIRIEERDKDKVFLFTSQFLREMHGPTKTVCDRAYFLQHYLGKKVTIINTAMLLPQKGDAPFYSRGQGGYLEEYLKIETFQFRDETFEFFQCEDNMPDLPTIQKILRKVMDEKPYCIINVGGGDLCADLCGVIVPEITVSTVFSDISTTCGKFQIVSSELKEEDCELLSILGEKEENVIKTLFTFTFKEQKNHYTRKAFGLAESSVVLLITGWRLDYEIQEDFLQMLEGLFAEKETFEAVFMGLFEKYEQMIENHPKLQERTHYLVNQEDALAVTELCNIYVNPKRKGGGTSAAEALYKGLPVVTLPFGDVAAASGKDFWVNDYDDMKNKIRQYSEDAVYYKKMSDLARERAVELTDSRKHFCEAFQKIERNPEFQ